MKPPRAATVAVIEEHLRYGAFYRDYLANHLPMALVALDAMGADDAAIRRNAVRHAAVLEPMPLPRFQIADGEEIDHLGQPAAFAAWVAYFERHLAAEGSAAVLGDWLDLFCTGVATAAFHGAIRVSFALRVGSPRELAHALAYWASAYEGLGGAPRPHGTLSVAQAFTRLAADPKLAGHRPAGNSIAERMRRARALPGFREAVDGADPARITLDAIAEAFIACYVASGNFTILHGVTGTLAFRELAPYVRRPEIAVRHLWQAAVAAWMAAGGPPVAGDGLEGDPGLAWPEILRHAAQCEDEHDIKLAYASWIEGERTGDDRYRRAASARVSHALRAAVA